MVRILRSYRSLRPIDRNLRPQFFLGCFAFVWCRSDVGPEHPRRVPGVSGLAGDSGNPPGRVRTPNRAAPHRSKTAEKNWGRRFRSFGRRLRWAGDSGPSPVNLRTDIRGAPHFGKKSRKEWGTGDSGSFGRRLRWPETPDHLRTSSVRKNQNCHNFCK